MGEYSFLAGSGLYSERFMQEVPAQAKRLISEVVAQTDYEVQRILLFGSRARGEALPDSDWDFSVITDCEPSPEEKRVIQMELIPKIFIKGFLHGKRGIVGSASPRRGLVPPEKKVYPAKWHGGEDLLFH
jgi:predicted nucleotidyltransferase